MANDEIPGIMLPVKEYKVVRFQGSTDATLFVSTGMQSVAANLNPEQVSDLTNQLIKAGAHGPALSGGKPRDPIQADSLGLAFDKSGSSAALVFQVGSIELSLVVPVGDLVGLYDLLQKSQPGGQSQKPN